jgi:predicted nuclease of restriction endonuclease-like (RecB) superfamily
LQKGESWGLAVAEQLATDLRDEFPAVPAKYRNQAKLAVKDEYTFDFLELGNEHSERELERAACWLNR